MIKKFPRTVENVIILLMPFGSLQASLEKREDSHAGTLEQQTWIGVSGERFISAESCSPSTGGSSCRPQVIFKPNVLFLLQREGKDEQRKKLPMDLAAPRQPASVLLQGKECRDTRQVLKHCFASTEETSASSFAIVRLFQWLCFLGCVSEANTLQRK